MAKIFVTGGAGYIGSHTVLALIQKGHEVVVFDNLSNSSLDNLHRVEDITKKQIKFIKGDILNSSELDEALKEGFDGAIHFAALKSVVESHSKPIWYYENNVAGSINLFKALIKNNVKNVIFSSSASVYGQPEKLPVDESEPLKPMSVYAKTKAMIENILEDSVEEGLNSIRLRYFNVAGADPSGLLGEDPMAMGNLIPRIFMSLIGKYKLTIYGNQFPTRDGYLIRDYIHVSDLADAHVKAIEYLLQNPGSRAINLGTNSGTSVLEIINEIEKVTGKKVEREIIAPQPGENIEIYANADLAGELLGWKAKYDYHKIISDAWNWYKNLPEFKNS